MMTAGMQPFCSRGQQLSNGCQQDDCGPEYDLNAAHARDWQCEIAESDQCPDHTPNHGRSATKSERIRPEKLKKHESAAIAAPHTLV